MLVIGGGIAGRRPEKPAQHVRGKISDLNTIKRNGRPKRYRSVVRTIHISREYFDMVPPRHQCTTGSMNRKAWTAIGLRLGGAPL